MARSEQSLQLADFFSALWELHGDVDEAWTKHIGYRSFWRGAESYRVAANDLQRIAEQCAEVVDLYRTRRKELGIGLGQSRGWAATIDYGQTLERFSRALAELCSEAWRVRVLDESYDEEDYRRNLGQLTDYKSEADEARSDLLHHLGERGIVRAPIRIRLAVVCLGGTVGGLLGLVGAGRLSGANEGLMPDSFSGCLIILGLAGLGTLLGAMAGLRQELE